MRVMVGFLLVLVADLLIAGGEKLLALEGRTRT